MARNIIDDLLNTFGRVATDAFQMSFSGNADELGQWWGYGSRGMGCSVVTSCQHVHGVADVAGWVIYEVARQRAFARKVLSKLRKVSDDAYIEQTLVAAACFMKHPGFKPEMEYHLIRFPDSSDILFREVGDRVVPYIDYLKGKAALPLTHVIIGPGWQLSGLTASEQAKHHVAQGVQRLLDARGISASVEASEIPYDPR